MKINESPSIILAFHGMLGRKKQTGLLLRTLHRHKMPCLHPHRPAQ